ncbi:MAG: hypothetical protein ACQER9_01080 [Nanobdellota archaeon]
MYSYYRKLIANKFSEFNPERFEDFWKWIEEKDLPIKVVASPSDGSIRSKYEDSSNMFDNWLNCYNYALWKTLDAKVPFSIFEAEAMLNDNFRLVNDNPSEGDLVIYTNPWLKRKKGLLDSENKFFSSGLHHWGIYREDGNVESKWGYIGCVFSHFIDILPEYWYGDINFYRRN